MLNILLDYQMVLARALHIKYVTPFNAESNNNCRLPISSRDITFGAFPRIGKL